MELLTGQCKKDFDTWREQRYDQLIDENKTEWTYYGYSVFNELCFSMQWGVYKEFFNTKKIILNVTTNCNENGDIIDYWGLVNHIMIYNDEGVYDFDDINYTMELLIKWGNKLYNERHLNNIEVQHKEIKKDKN